MERKDKEGRNCNDGEIKDENEDRVEVRG